MALHRWIAERVGNPGGYRDGDLGEVLAWLDAGYDPDRDIKPAVERAARRRNFQAPLMLRYFREPIAEQAERAPGMARRHRTSGPFPPSRRPFGPPQDEGGGGGQAELAEPPEPEGPAEWLAMRAALRRAVGEDVFASWFSRLEWRGVEGGLLRLAAPTRFIAGEARKRHGQALDAIAAATVAGADGVELVAEKRKGAGP